MVTAVNAASHSQEVDKADLNEIDPIHLMATRISKYLDIFRLPFKGVSALFGWGEVIPIKSGFLDFVAEQRLTVKLISSTFGIPKFLIKMVKLHKGVDDLRKTLVGKAEVNLAQAAHYVKNIFIRSVSLGISCLKIPQLLDKVRLIDLSKISRALPALLEKTENLFSLSMYSMKLVDSTWTLSSILSKAYAANAGETTKLSPKAWKAMMKVGSNAIKIISASATAAALFLGVYIPPVALITLSSVSFGVSLTSKVVRHSNLFWKSSERSQFDSTVHLPA